VHAGGNDKFDLLPRLEHCRQHGEDRSGGRDGRCGGSDRRAPRGRRLLLRAALANVETGPGESRTVQQRIKRTNTEEEVRRGMAAAALTQKVGQHFLDALVNV